MHFNNILGKIGSYFLQQLVTPLMTDTPLPNFTPLKIHTLANPSNDIAKTPLPMM